MYTVSIGESVLEFETRQAAIDAAKEATEATFKKARVSDGSGRESLTYMSGNLESYEYDTRRQGSQY